MGAGLNELVAKMGKIIDFRHNDDGSCQHVLQRSWEADMAWSLPMLKSEISPLEVATIVTTVSLGLSVVYNLGFFWHTEPSFISLLTIQDYAIGAIVGLLPILAPIFPFLIMPDMGLVGNVDPARAEGSGLKGSRRRAMRRLVWRALEFVRRHRVISYFLASTAITLSLVAAFLSPTLVVTWWFLAYLLVSAIFFFVLAGLTDFGKFELAFAGLAWVFATAFLTGLGSYEAASVRSPDDRVVLADKQVVSGRIVRVSSSFVFMLTDESLTVFSTSRIDRILNGSMRDE